MLFQNRGVREDICRNMVRARFPDDSVAVSKEGRRSLRNPWRCRFGKYMIAFLGTIGRQSWRELRQRCNLVLEGLTRCAEKVNRPLLSVYADVKDKKTDSANRGGRSIYIDVTQRLALFANRVLLRGYAAYPRDAAIFTYKGGLVPGVCPLRVYALWLEMLCQVFIKNVLLHRWNCGRSKRCWVSWKQHQRQRKASKTLLMQ